MASSRPCTWKEAEKTQIMFVKLHISAFASGETGGVSRRERVWSWPRSVSYAGVSGDLVGDPQLERRHEEHTGSGQP